MTYTPESVERLVKAARKLENDLTYFLDTETYPLLPEEIKRRNRLRLTTLTLNANLASLTEEKECCETIKRNDRSGKYLTTSCGHELWDDEISSTFTHCPYCGKPIKEKDVCEWSFIDGGMGSDYYKTGCGKREHMKEIESNSVCSCGRTIKEVTK